MKKLLKMFRWGAINSFFFIMLLGGLFYHYEWSLNIAQFMLWLTVTVSIILTIGKSFIPKDKLPIRSIPQSADNAFDTIIVLILASQGWFWSAGFWLLQLVLGNIIYDRRESVELNYQKLFNYLHKECNYIALNTQMDEIISIVEEMKNPKTESKK
jgi:hypothetical protein